MELTWATIALGCWFGVGWTIGSAAATGTIKALASVQFVLMDRAEWFVRVMYLGGARRSLVVRIGRFEVIV